MPEWLRRFLKMDVLPLGDDPSPAELLLEREMQRTTRTILRTQAQVVRTATMMPSWEDLYFGEKGERGYDNH